MIKGNVRHRITKLCMPTNQVATSRNVIFTRILLLLIEVRAELMLFPYTGTYRPAGPLNAFPFVLPHSLWFEKARVYRRRTDLNADWDLDVKYATHESDCRKFFCRFCCLDPFSVLFRTDFVLFAFTWRKAWHCHFIKIASVDTSHPQETKEGK